MGMIELRDVVKTYRGGVEALHGVNLTVERGDFLAIVGPSGSGKSTLLNLIGGLDRATSGSVMVDGLELTTASDDALARHRRKHIGFVFQSFFLSPRLSALENVLRPLYFGERRAHGARDVARSALCEVGLEPFLDRPASTLSGGQRQRVAIARALVTAAPILLADEPTGNLDSGTGQEVLELLGRTHREHGTTIVVVTHEAQTLRVAQRSLTLQEGRLS
ncbi:MAG: ABC transporter ATP-binding protein [Candidatus Xenobia bacterium]